MCRRFPSEAGSTPSPIPQAIISLETQPSRTLAPIFQEEVGYIQSCRDLEAAGVADTTKLHTDPDCLLLDNLEVRQIYILFKLLLLGVCVWGGGCQSDAAKFHPNCNQLEAAAL